MIDRVRAAFAEERLSAWTAKLVLLATFVFATNREALQRLSDIEPALYPRHLALWGTSLLAMAIVAFAPSLFVRALWALILSVGGAFGYAYHQASGGELTESVFLTLWVERAVAGRVVDFYRGATLSFGMLCLLGLSAFLSPPWPRTPVLRRWLHRLSFAPIVPALVIAAFYQSYARAPENTPRQLNFMPIAFSAALRITRAEAHERRPVTWTPSTESPPSLLLLVDESVRGDYLDFSPGNPYTPELAALRDRIVDFGPALSATSCSTESNAILRFMVERRSIIESIQTSPTLWQYAKAAGYRTVYIDAQRFIRPRGDDWRPQNQMRSAEMADIDVTHFLTGVSESRDADFELLRLVNRELSGGSPVLIYANKSGAHFPYDDNYPATETWFRPTMTDAGEDTSATRINSYRNNLRWVVDRFFKELFASTDAWLSASTDARLSASTDARLSASTDARLSASTDTRELVVLYTSDHGQSFEPGRLTHCDRGATDPDPRDVLVPLLAIAGDPALHERLAQGAAASHGRASHFQIAPTLLQLMGYTSRDVHSVYEATLFESAPEAPRVLWADLFQTLYMPTSSRQRTSMFDGIPTLTWHSIDPTGDYLEPHRP